jgi:tRNA-Thr(GGU) m(6)t(6)A37 methyltransferase TsaA
MTISIEPIGWVRAARAVAEDDNWGGATAVIELADGFAADSLAGLEDFSHAEILFHFNAVDPAKVVRDARHPRNNPDWPRVGIFAQRGKNRPNRLGSTIVRILARDGRALRVAELDAIDGTPVIDIKPVMQEFLPRTPVRQPAWVAELMRDYWR